MTGGHRVLERVASRHREMLGSISSVWTHSGLYGQHDADLFLCRSGVVCKECAGSELKSQIRTSPCRRPSLASTFASWSSVKRKNSKVQVTVRVHTCSCTCCMSCMCRVGEIDTTFLPKLSEVPLNVGRPASKLSRWMIGGHHALQKVSTHRHEMLSLFLGVRTPQAFMTVRAVHQACPFEHHRRAEDTTECPRDHAAEFAPLWSAPCFLKSCQKANCVLDDFLFSSLSNTRCMIRSATHRHKMPSLVLGARTLADLYAQ